MILDNLGILDQAVTVNLQNHLTSYKENNWTVGDGAIIGKERHRPFNLLLSYLFYTFYFWAHFADSF